MVIEPGPPAAPLAVFVSVVRQRVQRRTVDLLDSWRRVRRPCARLAFIQLPHEFPERGVDLGQAVEDASAKAAEQPSLDDQHGRSTFALSRGFRGRAGR